MFTGLLTALSAGIASLFASSTSAGKTLIGQSLSSGSIARLTHATSVDPITLVDNTLELNDRLDGVLELCVNIYASIYARALSTRNTTVNGTQIIKRLEALNPTNTSMRSLKAQYGLECLKDRDHSQMTGLNDLLEDDVIVPDYTLANESDKRPTAIGNFSAIPGLGFSFEDDKDEEPKLAKTLINKPASKDVFKDQPQLAFGKVVEYELKAEGETFVVPVSFRLAPSMVDNPSIVNAMISRFKSNETALERRVKWNTGSIDKLSELLFCTDLVRSDYKNMLGDKSGVYRKLRPSTTGEYTRALLRGEVSVAQASNILVISRATADIVEARSGGRFEDAQFRQKMLEETGIMLLVIIDPITDIIRLYIESMPNGHRIPGRNIVSASKKNGPDIEQILAVLTTGRGNLF